MPELQNRFRLDIRFQFGILACDPDWTNFSGLKEKNEVFSYF